MSDQENDSVIRGFDSFELKLGDELRGERATLGKSLLDIQRDLRIKAAYIAAIENCDLSVFENTSFLAGYVRSYARYLNLDPEATYARFCTESNYLGSNADIGRRREGGSGRVAAINASAHLDNWTPGLGGVAMKRDTSFSGLSAFGPVLVVLILIFGLGYGAWALVKDIQRVDIAPIEQSPTVLDTFDTGSFAAGLDSATFGRAEEQGLNLMRLYSDNALTVPIVAPRDGPIAAINPGLGGNFSSEEPRFTELQIAQAVTELVQVGSPIVTEQPLVQTVSIFAQRAAWVRVTDDNGSIIFEKNLEAGEEYTLPQGMALASLRAGNANWVFLLVDGEAFGPVPNEFGVAKGVSLAAADILNDVTALGKMTAEMRVATEEIRRTASLAAE